MCYEQAATRVCPPGTFNSAAQSARDCLDCFGFGKALSCQSADLFVFEILAPLTPYPLIGVKPIGGGNVEIHGPEVVMPLTPYLRPANNGYQVCSEYIICIFWVILFKVYLMYLIIIFLFVLVGNTSIT